MKIIVYSETTANTVKDNLGLPEYSYYFILDKYLPALHALGDVIFVRDPENEVDALYEAASRAGEKAVFLSFTPPHRIAKKLRCPTICVLAWEFDAIPYESWDPDEPWHNWVDAINKIGHVITISEYATGVIRRQVNPEVKVDTVPAPVVSAPRLGARLATVLEAFFRLGRHPGGAKQPLSISAAIIDSNALTIDAEGVTTKNSTARFLGAKQDVWDGQAVDWNFSSESGNNGQYLVGFYGEEEWGCWSKTSHPSIMLPWRVAGQFELLLELVAYGENQGRMLDVRIGDQVAQLQMNAARDTHTLSFSIAGDGANAIHFDGVTAVSTPGARDHRTLGIGLSRLILKRAGEADAVTVPPPSATVSDVPESDSPTSLELSGTVYSSVFNPTDGRKNWNDMVSAFCWAFRNDPDKTLVLKMSHYNSSAFLGALWLLFSRLSPFKCRVIVIHGFLSDEELRGLIERTDYFVNSSLAEGQCLPLLEFMAMGVPSIAPDHTAMESYIDTDNAFVVASGLQPYIWPNDPRRAYRTYSHRINWNSLRLAFLQSAETVDNDKERYRAMSHAARRIVYEKFSTERAVGLLRSALHAATG